MTTSDLEQKNLDRKALQRVQKSRTATILMLGITIAASIIVALWFAG